jgi:membrane protein implicated in regulation of membrane protease activity
MRWDVFAWAAIALVLFALEALAPGAFMLWLGFAATAVLLVVLLLPGIPLLVQVGAFVLLGFAAIQVYRRWFRGREPQGDKPTLNRRTAALLGEVVVLHEPIVAGSGRVQIADAYWTVSGPDLPAGARVRVTGATGMHLQVEPA